MFLEHVLTDAEIAPTRRVGTALIADARYLPLRVARHRSASMRSRVDGTLPKMTMPLMDNTVAIVPGTTHTLMS